MKKIVALSILVLSFNSFANSNDGTTITVPYPTQQSAFYGTISQLENDIKKELTDKAIVVCGNKENLAAISDVEVKIAFDTIVINKEIFEGLYPLAAASAIAHCRKDQVVRH